ncbi:hypothetical protein SAMN04488581_0401 [Mycolicibacterium neoaurum]|uniref:hypothetical protein n=1 Tax=Mycolicibacterium neoaurum TaxID=1795 RepID=UPI00056B1A0B|nr:hypothetical protein [Mycolicibacterium neoaurum]SDC25881.1 hypothetical protein SAMN04488581_0401 [Mycolicibacterium neoaurum]
MPDFSAGTASVRIKPDASDFVRLLNAKLKAVKDPGFAISVTANTAQAAADIRRFRDIEGRNGIRVGVDADLSKAQAGVAAFRARQHADDLTIKVDVDTKAATAQLASTTRQLNSLRAASALRLNLGAGLISSVGPAVTGLAQVTAGIQQLAGAALVLPGALAAAGASIGTLAFGLSGISDAYKAVSDAADSSGKDQASSARAATQASNTLRNAVNDEAQARRDVADATRDARNELRDLHTEMRGGLIDESRAILQAQQARERFAKGDYTDQRDAQLDILEADQRLLEVRTRNADRAAELTEANAKGVAGSDQVVAANERLVRSQQQVAEAQAGVADSATASSAAQDKAAQAMAKLSPNAQKLVQTLVDMKPQFAEFRAAASEPLLEGKADEFREFYDTVSPHLQAGMANIARALNQNITALFDSAGSQNGLGLLDRIMGNTAEAQSRFTAAVDPIMRAMGTLTAAGTDALPRLADATADVFERLATALDKADRDGRLDKWINDGLTGMTHLGNATLNIGKAINAVSTAAGGGSFLEWLETVTDKMQTFLNSDEGQERLKKFFADGRDLFEKWRPILQDIPGLMSSVHSAAVTYIGGVATVISPITELLREHPDLVKTAALAYLGWKSISGVTALLGNLQLMSNRLSVDLPNAADKGAKGINRSLAGIAIPAALGTVLATGNNVSATNSAGANLAGAATNVGGAALSGAMVAGAPGAIVGAISGLGISIYQRVLSDIEEGRREWEAKWEADRAAGPNRPGSPDIANQVTGRNGVLQPSLYNPDGTIKRSANDELRRKIAAGQMPGYSINPQGQIVGPNGQVVTIPGFRNGGPTPTGRGNGPTGGHLAELHGDEWVLPKEARRAVGDDVLAALTAGRGFYPGGEMVDEFGNPVTPGAAPGPGGTVSGPATAAIAPNPTAPGTGGVGSILSQVVSGMQGPIGNALALGQQLGSIAAPAPAGGGGVDPNTTVHGAGAGAAPGGGLGSGLGAIAGGGDFASRMAGIPGFAGLFGSLASPDPQGALMNWGSQTANWVADWGMNTLSSVGSTLWQGALGFFGLENSILSPSNPYNQAIAQTGQFYMDQQGPLGKLLGMGSGGAGGGTLNAAALGGQYGLDDATLATLFGGNGGALDEAKLQALLNGGPRGGGSDAGLQINTLKAKRAIAAAFPQITEFGGVRKDALKWHPNGLAIDVMIPGQGGNNDPTTPEGLALGNQIYDFIMANKEALGVDYVMWQEKDHYNHLHVNTTGGGYPDAPGMEKGGPTPDYMGPVDSKGGHLAVVHPKEFMISARGRANVPDSFLHALNRGLVDPKDLPGYFPGGAIRPLAAVAQPTPRPPVTPARTLNPRPAQPTPPPQQQPARQMPTPPAPAAPPPVAATPAQQQQSIAASGPQSPSIIAKNPGAGGINHNVDWMNTLIQSSASNIGQLVSTGMSIASMGAAGVPGAGAIGAAGPFAAGGIQQVGKVVEGIVNVVSSSLVGSVPGSFGGETGASPYGRVIRPEPQSPQSGGSGGNNYTFNGISDVNRLMDRMELSDKMTAQATLAKHY